MVIFWLRLYKSRIKLVDGRRSLYITYIIHLFYISCYCNDTIQEGHVTTYVLLLLHY